MLPRQRLCAYHSPADKQAKRRAGGATTEPLPRPSKLGAAAAVKDEELFEGDKAVSEAPDFARQAEPRGSVHHEAPEHPAQQARQLLCIKCVESSIRDSIFCSCPKRAVQTRRQASGRRTLQARARSPCSGRQKHYSDLPYHFIVPRASSASVFLGSRQHSQQGIQQGDKQHSICYGSKIA